MNSDLLSVPHESHGSHATRRPPGAALPATRSDRLCAPSRRIRPTLRAQAERRRTDETPCPEAAGRFARHKPVTIGAQYAKIYFRQGMRQSRSLVREVCGSSAAGSPIKAMVEGLRPTPPPPSAMGDQHQHEIDVCRPSGGSQQDYRAEQHQQRSQAPSRPPAARAFLGEQACRSACPTSTVRITAPMKGKRHQARPPLQHRHAAFALKIIWQPGQEEILGVEPPQALRPASGPSMEVEPKQAPAIQSRGHRPAHPFCTAVTLPAEINARLLRAEASFAASGMRNQIIQAKSQTKPTARGRQGRSRANRRR